jgi:hypothetical protein
VTAKNSSIVFAVVVGGVFSIAIAALLFNGVFSNSVGDYVLFLAMPGIALSIALGVNVHAFNPVLMILLNGIIYGALVWVIDFAVRKVRGN